MANFLNLDVIYEDNHLLVVNKPPGILVQGDSTDRISLLQVAKDYIKVRYGKKGNVFLAIVHRLDRPVSGVIVFGRNSKSASRLAQMFRERKVEKVYLSLCQGIFKDKEGILKDQISWRDDKGKAEIVKGSALSKEAITYYEVLFEHENISLLRLFPKTGRKHQLRAQLSARGHPILGDTKYGGRRIEEDAICLHCCSLKFPHPVKKEDMEFKAKIPSFWKKLYPEKVITSLG